MTAEQWSTIEHFKSNEFDSPDAVGSGRQMNLDFVRLLDHLRVMAGFPFIVHSGFRTPEHNAALAGTGAVTDSAHLRGRAADIGAATSAMKFAIVMHAVALGVKRIGIGKTFVHLDNDTTLPQKVIWLYS